MKRLLFGAAFLVFFGGALFCSLAASPAHVQKWEYARYYRAGGQIAWQDREKTFVSSKNRENNFEAMNQAILQYLTGEQKQSDQIKLFDIVQAAGQQGWELVTMQPEIPEGSEVVRNERVFIFKRPIP